MKRSPKTILFILLTSLLLLGCQCLALPVLGDFYDSLLREPFHATPVQPTTAATTTPSTANTSMYLTEVSRGEEAEDHAYTISMIHPQLENGGAESDAFNLLLTTRLLESVNQFREIANENFQGLSSDVSSYYDQNYSVYWFDQRFVSILFIEESYINGAVHPTQQHFVLNYDFLTQQEVLIGDIFLPDSYILTRLQQYCAAQLEQRFPEGYFTDGLSPKSSNYARWNLSPQGMVFTFEEYQVNAYAYGPQTVVVPFELLEPFIDPLGPLGFLAAMQEQEHTF